MATAAEMENLGEAAAIALRLREKKDEKDQLDTYIDNIRHKRDMPIMVALVSNKKATLPDERTANTSMLREWLKLSKAHYDATEAGIEKALSREQTITSAGFIPYPVKAKHAMTRRTLNNLTNVHEAMSFKARQSKQNKDVSVQLKIHNDPNVKKYIRIVVTQNYLDESKTSQPSHHVEINITDRNARKAEYVHVPGQPDPAFPEADVGLHDVSDPAYRSQLEHLYGHALKDDKHCFSNLVVTLSEDQHLWLLSVPYNNAHWTSNLFSNVTDRPPLLSAFEEAVEHSPQIFILLRVRINTAQAIRRNMVKDFAEQSYLDPLRDILVLEPSKRQVINEDSLVKFQDLPRFQVESAESSFDQWDDYELRTGAAAIYEATWADKRTSYTGTSVLLPLPHTYVIDHKLYMVHAGAVNLSDQSSKKPKLQKGSRIKIWIDSNNPTTDHPWDATVWDRFAWAPFGSTCFYTTRPYDEGKVLDTRHVHFIEHQDIDRWSLHQLRNHVTSVKKNDVEILVEVNHKELKQRVNALSAMQVPLEMVTADPERAASLQHSQLMFMCKQPNALPRSGLYDDVQDDDIALDYIFHQLQPDQADVLRNLVDQGMLNRSALITGISGGGKSHVMVVAGTRFLDMVSTTNHLNVQRSIDLDNLHNPKREYTTAGHDEDSNSSRKKLNIVKSDMTNPSFLQPDNDDYDPEMRFYEKGRSLYVAATNDTTDALYRTVKRNVEKYTAGTNREPALVYRRYAEHTEVAAVKAVLHPDWAKGHDLPDDFNDQTQVKAGGNNAAMRDEFLKFQNGSRYRAIHDSRFTDFQSSMAFHAHALAMPDEAQTAGIRSAFTQVERDMLRRLLRPMLDVQGELKSTGGTWTPELGKAVEDACRIAFDWLDLKADVVVATASAANEHRFILHRQPHFIGIEEVGRLDDPRLMAFWSLYWNTNARIAVGDYRQLGPQLFSDKSDNPLYHQAKYSFLSRSIDTGFGVPELLTTQRFSNEEVLEVVRDINQNQSIQMRDGTERPQDTAFVRKIHRNIFPELQIETAVLFVDVPRSENAVQKDRAGSCYNTATAVVSINLMDQLIRNGIKGDQIVITSAYRTQTEVHRFLAAALAKEASGSHAAEILKVRFSTIDSFMGEESFYHIFDTISRPGHVYAEVARAVVADTRAEVGFMKIGSAAALCQHEFRYPWEHPFKQAIRNMIRARRYVVVKSDEVARLKQFQTTIQALGLSAERQRWDYGDDE